MDQKGLHTTLHDGVLSSSSFGNEQDNALIDKIIFVLSQEEISVSKALAVLDAARTAVLKRTMLMTGKSTINEVRAMYGLTPIKDGDVLLTRTDKKGST